MNNHKPQYSNHGAPICLPLLLLLAANLVSSFHYNPNNNNHYQLYNGFLANRQPHLMLHDAPLVGKPQIPATLELPSLTTHLEMRQQPPPQLYQVAPTNPQQQASLLPPPTSQQQQLSQLQLQLQQQQPQQPQQQPQQQPEPQQREGLMLRYEIINSTSVKLKWNLRYGHPQPDYFDLIYGPVPDTQVVNISQIDRTARDRTITMLMPETTYQFELQSYRNQRPYRSDLQLVTMPAASADQAAATRPQVDLVPLAVKAEPRTPQSIQLSWIESDRPNALRSVNKVNIIRYYATANETTSLGSSPKYHYLNVTNAQESRVLVSKLKPFTEYAFAVKTLYYSYDMRKLYSHSSFSMDTLARTLEMEPSPPRNFTIRPESIGADQALLDTGKLHFSWLPPEHPNGQLLGYVILYAQEQNAPDDQWTRIEVNTTSLDSWYVTNLKPGSRFFFKMRAFNQRGQSQDSEVRVHTAPTNPPSDRLTNQPIPPNNLLLLVVICMVAILFLLFLIVSRLASSKRKKPSRKGSILNNSTTNGSARTHLDSTSGMKPLDGFASNHTAASSTVAARVGTLARRRDNTTSKPDFWISAMDQQQAGSDIKSEKSLQDMNMAMVSIQRDSPQFATTQIANALPDYNRFVAPPLAEMVQQSQQSHYHPGQFGGGAFAYDQMDSATANALMTLSKRQQQQIQRAQYQFAPTSAPLTSQASTNAQAPSPHQQPPPPPPLNIEHQQQPLYGSHQQLTSTRSLRLHKPTIYDPVSGSFLHSTDVAPPNYNSHLPMGSQSFVTSANSNTLQMHPHQTSTLLGRRSTNTLRSFQNSGSTNYGQLLGSTVGSFIQAPLNSTINNNSGQLLQSHQAVINQLNNSSYPSLPLKHVQGARPQILSSLEDQIETELAEKNQQSPHQLDQPVPVKQ